MEFNPLFWWKTPNKLMARYGPDERVKAEVEESKKLNLTSLYPDPTKDGLMMMKRLATQLAN